VHHAQYEKARWNLKFGLLVHAKFAFYHDKMLCRAKLLHGMKCQCSSWRLLKLTLLREADDTSRVVFTHESSIESVFMFCLVDTYYKSKCLKYNKGGLSLMTQFFLFKLKYDEWNESCLLNLIWGLKSRSSSSSSSANEWFQYSPSEFNTFRTIAVQTIEVIFSCREPGE
jgi:hypothetical protein